MPTPPDTTVAFPLTLEEALSALGIENRREKDLDFIQVPWPNVESEEFFIPSKFERLRTEQPEVVRQCSTDALRFAYEDAYTNRQRAAIRRGLEALSAVPCHYHGFDASGAQQAINVRASVTFTESEDGGYLVTFTNLHHFVNAMIDGVGVCYPDLATDEPLTEEEEAKQRFIGSVPAYFLVFGIPTPRVDTDRLDDSVTSYDRHFRSLLTEATEATESNR